MIEGLLMLKSSKKWFLWKAYTVYFPTELTLCDSDFCAETTTPGSRVVGLFSAFEMIFPSFLARIPVSG